MSAPILKGLLLGLILSISVGPVVFAIIKQSLTNRHKAGYVFVAGVSASDMVLLFICNVFTSLFAIVLNHKATIALLGAGFLMNTLNPSVFLFWFAWTAAIGNSAGETSNPTTYKLIVFGTCLGFVMLSDLAKVALAGTLRPRLTEKNLVWLNRISGIIILIFSAVLFYGALTY